MPVKKPPIEDTQISRMTLTVPINIREQIVQYFEEYFPHLEIHSMRLNYDDIDWDEEHTADDYSVTVDLETGWL